MKANNKVEVRVVKILERGTCSFGHQVGDRWVFDGRTPAGLCLSAVHTLFPLIQVLRWGGTPSWAEEDGKAQMCCCDHLNPVVFEARRLDEPIG